jgi:diadenylate cyclase
VDKLRPSMEDNLVEALKMIAPGTQLREAIENIVHSRHGALLVFAEEERVAPLISGGISIDVAVRPMLLYELTKLDGAIILDPAGSHIMHANVQLMPDANIESQETGTRHRTAERVAKQLGVLAISISAARDVVTVYVGGVRYIMDPIRVILSKADQALLTLERFRNRLSQVARTLSVLEFRRAVTLFEVASVLQRTEMVLTLSHLIERYVVELGTEGRLVHMQMEELLLNVREDRAAVVSDYLVDYTPARAETALAELISLPTDEIISMDRVAAILGYSPDATVLETHVQPRGCRLLRRIPRLSSEAIQNVMERYGSLQAIMEAPVEELATVDKVGLARAVTIKEGLNRLREVDVLERYG